MTLRVTEEEFRLLADFIEKECGNRLGEEKAYLIEHRLSKYVTECGCRTFLDFYMKARKEPHGGRLRTFLVDAITNKETYWFRDRYPYAILKTRILPQLRTDIAAGKLDRFRIWSAGCSSGQEPYSIAMTVLDYYSEIRHERDGFDEVEVLATDISLGALKEAREGKYGAASVGRGLSEDMLERHFVQEHKTWAVRDSVKKLVVFRQLNLQDPLVGLGPFHLVFLRNVTIYFSDELKRDLFARVVRVLAPGAYLFLGTGEIAHGHEHRFEMLKDGGGIYYRFKPTTASRSAV